MMNRKITPAAAGLLLVAACLLFSAFHETAPKPKAATPPMGWNSWNWFGKKNIDERVVREVVDAMDAQGLQKAGYTYVVVDGGWRDTKLAADGSLIASPEKFPHGMKALADYAHEKGLKFGLHIVPGTADCIGDKVGGFGHEKVQLQQFIDWGIDFLKIDKCKFQGGWNEQLLKATYQKWSRLIAEKKADIVLSISAYKFRDWYPSVAQMARTTDDISTIAGGMSGCSAVFDDSIPEAENKWGLLSVMQVAEINNQSAAYAGHGYWNDADMLVTGEQGLSEVQQQAHFALWCIMSSPLMLGNDPRHMTAAEKNIILNADCLSIDQDPTEQGKRMQKNGDAEIWVKKLGQGGAAVLLLNRNKSRAQDIRLAFSENGLPDQVVVKDIYAKKILGNFTRSLTQTVLPGRGLFLLLNKPN